MLSLPPMNHRLITIGCALFMSTLVAHAEEESTPLAKQMGTFDDAYKAFRRETDPVKGAGYAREAQAAVLKALTETPGILSKMPDDATRQKAAAEYRKMLAKVYVTLCEVEEAFIAGEIDKVSKLVDSLKEMKKAGHEKFMEEE
jgi:soluble cytochrome b562